MTDKDTDYLKLRGRLLAHMQADLHVLRVCTEAAAAIKSLQAEVARLRAENAELREHANAMALQLEESADAFESDLMAVGHQPDGIDRHIAMAGLAQRLTEIREVLAAYRAWQEGKK